jgi:hypothetical protein
MAKPCSICTHPKRADIMASVAKKRHIGLVAYYFRVDKMDLVKHCRHEPSAQTTMSSTIAPVNDDTVDEASMPGSEPVTEPSAHLVIDCQNDGTVPKRLYSAEDLHATAADVFGTTASHIATWKPRFPETLAPLRIPLAAVPPEQMDDHFTEETPLDVLKRGLPYIKQAVRLAGEDRQAQERIIAALNAALAAEDMGL